MILDRACKCHLEVTCKCVEYSWTQYELFLQCVPFQLSRGYAYFLKHVAISLSQSAGAKQTKQGIWKFSERIRDYIASYYIMHSYRQTILLYVDDVSDILLDNYDNSIRLASIMSMCCLFYDFVRTSYN